MNAAASTTMVMFLITPLIGCGDGLSIRASILSKKSKAKLSELSSLPVGITVSHSPDPVEAQRGGKSDFRYTWVYKTTVMSSVGELTIEEFGAFAWDRGQWVLANFTGKPFTADDFADWYSCPNAKLQPGTLYFDPSNWSGSDSLGVGKARWYFIGRDKQGKRFKGEATVIQTRTLKNPGK